jgi:Amt family ammonium transporter
MLFSAGWFTLVYVPLAHWIWGGGFLGQAGVLDFAGGLVVHLSAGTAGLVACLMLGNRRGYGSENLAPYDLSLAVIGTGLLWVGWFGFNGGSALQANSRAVMAIMSTHLAACAGALIWSALEWVTRRKPSVLGMISGAVAGLGTITPASGFVSPAAGIFIGLVAGAACFWACTSLKHRFKYDDTLDVFGIHGIGGLLGTLAVGVFASHAIGGTAGLLEGNPHQLLIQVYGVVVTLVWTAGVTWALLKAIDLMVTLRVSRENEVEGLDITQHGEALQ